jgi:Zn-dependent alcohol dehydrogenase
MPEETLVERIKNACDGCVDFIVNYGTTYRSLKRSLESLNNGGYVYINGIATETLMPKFITKAHENGKFIECWEI